MGDTLKKKAGAKGKPEPINAEQPTAGKQHARTLTTARQRKRTSKGKPKAQSGKGLSYLIGQKNPNRKPQGTQPTKPTEPNQPAGTPETLMNGGGTDTTAKGEA